jgi:hypothetical protein
MVASVGYTRKVKKNSMIIMDEAIKFTSQICEEPLLFMWEKSIFCCNVWSVLHKFVLECPTLEVFQLSLFLPYYLQLYFSPGCEWCRHMETKTWRTTWVLLPYSDHNVCVSARVRACISMLETFVHMNLMVQKRQSRPRNLKNIKTKKF